MEPDPLEIEEGPLTDVSNCQTGNEDDDGTLSFMVSLFKVIRPDAGSKNVYS
jgi:hypothetical protein